MTSYPALVTAPGNAAQTDASHGCLCRTSFFVIRRIRQ